MPTQQITRQVTASTSSLAPQSNPRNGMLEQGALLIYNTPSAMHETHLLLVLSRYVSILGILG